MRRSNVRDGPSRPCGREGLLLLVSKSSGLGSRRQNRPDFMQHRLNTLPLPHGHGSLRPNFSSSSLSPWTIRTPRFTFISDGKPRRRLRIGLKKGLVVEVIVEHGAPSLRGIQVDVQTPEERQRFGSQDLHGSKHHAERMMVIEPVLTSGG